MKMNVKLKSEILYHEGRLSGELKVLDIEGRMDEFLRLYYDDREGVRWNMYKLAERAIWNAYSSGYYDYESLEILNFSEICGWLGWPDLQDGGIFEQAIMEGAKGVEARLRMKD